MLFRPGNTLEVQTLFPGRLPRAVSVGGQRVCNPTPSREAPPPTPGDLRLLLIPLGETGEQQE